MNKHAQFSAGTFALSLLLYSAGAVAAERYLFPSSPADLGDGHYWIVDEFSEGPNILDLNVKRWDAAEQRWTRRKEGVTQSGYDKAPSNDKHLTFGLPLYAPADGEIIACWRNAPDNPEPGKKLPEVLKTIFRGGNHVYIKTAGGNAFTVAHLKKGSLLSALCPHDDEFAKDATERLPNDCPTADKDPGGFQKEAFIPEGRRPKVKKGQYIGDAGNSGSSGGPHIHIHLRPLNGTVMCPSIAIPFDNAWRQDYFSDKPASKGSWEKLDGKAITDAVGNSSVLPAYPPGYQEIAKHGVPAAEYQFTFEHITGSGYRLEWIDGFNVKGKIHFNVIFRPDDGTKRAAFHNLAGAQYQAEYDKYKGLGYRLMQVDSYPAGNQVLYAGIFAKDGGPRVTAYHGIPAAEHQTKFDELTAGDWKPKNISVVSLNGNRLYTALYEKINPVSSEAKSFLTPEEYQKESDDNKQKGRQLIYLNAYEHNGTPRFTAIWRAGVSGNFKARHDLSGSEYQEEWEDARKSGMLTHAVTGYVDGNAVRYAAVWRK